MGLLRIRLNDKDNLTELKRWMQTESRWWWKKFRVYFQSFKEIRRPSSVKNNKPELLSIVHYYYCYFICSNDVLFSASLTFCLCSLRRPAVFTFHVRRQRNWWNLGGNGHWGCRCHNLCIHLSALDRSFVFIEKLVFLGRGIPEGFHRSYAVWMHSSISLMTWCTANSPLHPKQWTWWLQFTELCI